MTNGFLQNAQGKKGEQNKRCVFSVHGFALFCVEV
jgi:hypothetical protein